MINSSSGKIISSDSHELLKDRECIILRKKIKKIQELNYEIKLIPQKLKIPFNIEIRDTPFTDKFNSIEVDPSLLNSTLEIKKPFSGAYFYPSGMNGKKKLSKYFKDEKYSSFEKENQWILTSKNDVVWIIGKRADSRFLSNINSNKTMYIRIDLS